MASVDARQVVGALESLESETERALVTELDVLAQLFARRMKLTVKKFRSETANSINVQAPSPLVREIKPGTAHAQYLEDGVKPGGKGLPRFFDPASASIVAWLKTKAFSGRSTPRKFSKGAQVANLELRDRYEGLAWHIRHKGVKASPFVGPTFRALEPTARVRLLAAVQAVARSSGAAGGSVA